MNLGNQSTLNDLRDLESQTANQISQLNNSLTAQIQEAKAIKVDGVSQIENGNLSSGNLFDPDRPTGVYHVHQSLNGVHDDPELSGENSEKNGMLLHLESPYPEKYFTGIFMQWGGRVNFMFAKSGEYKHVEALTKENTIVDANGFIKTA